MFPSKHILVCSLVVWECNFVVVRVEKQVAIETILSKKMITLVYLCKEFLDQSICQRGPLTSHALFLSKHQSRLH